MSLATHGRESQTTSIRHHKNIYKIYYGDRFVTALSDINDSGNTIVS